MKQLTTLSFALVLICGAAPAQESTGTGQVEGNPEEGEAQKPEREKMNALTSQAFQAAFKGINKSGHFYPFALYEENGEIQSISFDMDSGEKPPEAKKWVPHLFKQLRKKAQESDTMNVAAVARLHMVQGKNKGEDGKQDRVMGVWVVVDHRDTRPIVAFMPLPEQEDGTHKPGNMIYSGTDNWIFPSSKGNRDD